jgi:hypothetical protein
VTGVAAHARVAEIGEEGDLAEPPPALRSQRRPRMARDEAQLADRGGGRVDLADDAGEAIQDRETRAVGERAERLRARMERRAAPVIVAEILARPDERLPFRRRDLDAPRSAARAVWSSTVASRVAIENDDASGRDVRHVEQPARVVEREPRRHTAPHRYVAEKAPAASTTPIPPFIDTSIRRAFGPTFGPMLATKATRAIAEDQITSALSAHDVAREALGPAADDRGAGAGRARISRRVSRSTSDWSPEPWLPTTRSVPPRPSATGFGFTPTAIVSISRRASRSITWTASVNRLVTYARRRSESTATSSHSGGTAMRIGACSTSSNGTSRSSAENCRSTTSHQRPRPSR